MPIATPFAAAEAQLAASVVSLMANAVVTLGSGAAAGVQMPAVFSQPVVDGLGSMHMPGREPSVLVPISVLVVDVQKGSTLDVLYRGATTTWRVQRRTDTPEAGDSLLDLEHLA